MAAYVIETRPAKRHASVIQVTVDRTVNCLNVMDIVTIKYVFQLVVIECFIK